MARRLPTRRWAVAVLAVTIARPLAAQTAAATATAATEPALPEVTAESKEPTAPGQNAEVSVAGTRVERTPGSAHVVGKKQLARFRYDDPLAVLVQAPGVYVRQEDGMGLRPNIGMRGVNPDRSKKITLMEDGVLFGPAPYSAPAAYFFPLIGRMTAVRVIKGPGALVYGPQTVGGAVDLVTRPIPSESGGALDVGIGEYGYGKAHGYFGSSDGQVGFLMEGIHLENSGFKELPGGADTGFARTEWMMKASYLVDPSARETNELTLKVTYSDEVSNETYLGLTDADFRRNPYQRYPASALDQMKNHRISVVAGHEFRARSGMSITTTAYRHDYARIWRKVNGVRAADVAILDVLRAPDTPRNRTFYGALRGGSDGGTGPETILIGPNDRTFVSQGVQAITRLDAATLPFRHHLEFGVRLHNDGIERRHSEDGFLMIGDQLVPEGTRTVVTTFNADESSALALHAVDVVSFRRLTLTPGVRVEVIRGTTEDRASGARQSNLEHAFLPGLGAYFGLIDELGVLAGAYRGFSPPPPGSAPPTDPEYSVNYEAGVRATPEGGRAEAIAFYNDYSNLTDVCTFSSGCADANLDRQFDAGEARIYGAETFLQYELAVGLGFRVPAAAAYTLTFSEFLNTFASQDPMYGDVESGDELPYVPRHQLTGSLGLEYDRGGVSAAFNYVSPMREEAGREPLGETLSTDEQVWMDASASFRPIAGVTTYVNVRNVTSAAHIVSHRPFGARPNAPRWIQLGVKVEF